MVDMFLDVGSNIFDTAYSLGLTEEILGKVITGKCSKLLIAIKKDIFYGRKL